MLPYVKLFYWPLATSCLFCDWCYMTLSSSHCFDVLIIIECSTNEICVWREHDWHLLTQCKTAFSHLQNLFFSQENKSVVISSFLSNLFNPEKMPISLAKKGDIEDIIWLAVSKTLEYTWRNIYRNLWKLRSPEGG